MAITADQLKALADSFPWDEWNAKLGEGLTQCYRDVLHVAAGRVKSDFDLEDPFTSRFMTDYIGERIVTLDTFTKERVSTMLATALADAEKRSIADLATLVKEAASTEFQSQARWRALRIARTETGFAYNHGTVLGHYQAGGKHVLVSDGDQDEPCASANGATWTIDEALTNPLAHPNCVRAFSPAD